ncbi:hypothetical protein LLEC1_02842 [Akanthomyces lecanii]|uniref:DUF6546 domain-containing protein n=1 Tax=Cordyceps confragosa TaxID=2714763 RepID=A0A179IHG6_CORDF|nr:hypothetical protein LLEC1_02842 [Akanthomyces lecanii]
MASLPLSEGESDRWARLPQELRRLIFGYLIAKDYPLSKLVTVSRQWQGDLEPHIFARIRVTPSRAVDFDAMTRRSNSLIRYIWFCLKLEDYDCDDCAPALIRERRVDITNLEYCPVSVTFRHLFSAFSTRNHRGLLTLDISIYAPSDSEHWFPYLTFLPDTLPEMPQGRGPERTAPAKVGSHRPRPRRTDSADPPASILQLQALKRTFGTMEKGLFDPTIGCAWWLQLPALPVVDRLLLRRQNRRKWSPAALRHMIARFTNLRELYYEPREELFLMQELADIDCEHFFPAISPPCGPNLQKLVVFENCNKQHPFVQRGVWYRESIRKASPLVSKIMARTSTGLHHLAASYIADAARFFAGASDSEWPNLTTLTLTAEMLDPETDPARMAGLLRDAATVAAKMPRLECDISRKAHQATITWRGTWEWAMKNLIIEAWEPVLLRDDVWRLEIAEEVVDKKTVGSRAEAIKQLKLSGVIRPVSLQQMKLEQKAFGENTACSSGDGI